MSETTAMRQYRALEVELRALRSTTTVCEADEDRVLDEMERLWWELSEEERDILDTERPTCDRPSGFAV